MNSFLASLVKWLSVCLRTKWLWAPVPLLSLEIVMLFNFRVFLRMYTFKVATFSLTSTYPINSFFSVVVCTYKIDVFDEAFSLLAIVAMITEKMFFLFPWQPLLGKNLFIKSCSLSRKFYMRRNNNKVDSIETGPIVIAHLLPWIDLVTETDKECGHTKTLSMLVVLTKVVKLLLFLT